MSFSPSSLSPLRNSSRRLSSGDIGVSPVEIGYAINPIAHWNTLNMQVAGAVTPALYDLTGNYDLLQATGAKQPTINNTELNKPVIYFDGNATAANADNMVTSIAIPFNTTNKITIQILIRDNYKGGAFSIYSTTPNLQTPTVGSFYGIINAPTNPMIIGHFGNVGFSRLIETGFNYSWKLITATHDLSLATNEVQGSSNLGVFGSTYLNNNNNTDAAFASLALSLGGFTEGASINRYAQFYFAEMIIHNRILTEDEQLRQARQILSNYGLLQNIY